MSDLIFVVATKSHVGENVVALIIVGILDLAGGGRREVSASSATVSATVIVRIFEF